MPENYQEKQTVLAGIVAAFGGKGEFEQFERDCAEWPMAPKRVIELALESGLAKINSRKSLVEYLNAQDEISTKLSLNSFSACIDALRREHSVNSLVRWVNEECKKLTFPAPPLQAPMLSRLKDNFNLNTPRKRCAVRLLAFWAGIFRPELGLTFRHIASLPITFSTEFSRRNDDSGIILAIGIRSRGDLVPPAAILWLREQLARCVHDLRLHHLLGLRTVDEFDASSVIMHISARPGVPGDLRIYNQAVRDSLALAHQMTVHWRLSSFTTPNRALVMVIHAGIFSHTHSHLQLLLDAPFPRDSSIVLTEMAYQCAKEADVKVGFKMCEPSLCAVPGHRYQSLWYVEYFWTHTYLDYVPILLTSNNLPIGPGPDLEQFRKELYFGVDGGKEAFGSVTVIHTYPSSEIVLLEMAKVCMGRRMFHEADYILSKVLNVNPLHVVARVMRMLVYLNVSMLQDTVEASDSSVERAAQESKFLQTLHTVDPEVWCEAGLLYYWSAFKKLMMLRKQAAGIKNSDSIIADAIGLFDQAQDCFARGMVVSSSGTDNRTLFWVVYTKAIMAMLKNKASKNDLLAKTGMCDTQGVFIQCSASFFSTIGWIDPIAACTHRTAPDVLEIMREKDIRQLLAMLSQHIDSYSNCALSRSYVPNIFFAFSAIIWDFIPNLPSSMCVRIIEWLNQAIQIAQLCKQDNLAIFACTRCFSLYQPAEDFIADMHDTIKTIKSILPSGFLERNDDVMLDRGSALKRLKIKLMFLHVDC
jgi:hypothetical protein